MQLYLDSADLSEIEAAVETGLLDGVTTNPTLLSKQEDNRTTNQLVKKICEISHVPVSAEVTKTDYEGICEEGKYLSALDPRVVVKTPLTIDGLKATKTLSDEGIATNVTLCFSANQALLAAKSGASYVSPFLGRIDDVGWPSLDLIDDIRKIYDNYGFDTKILAASIRHPEHVLQVAKKSADVATMPYKVFKQLYEHPLTDKGLTKFLEDAAAMKDGPVSG